MTRLTINIGVVALSVFLVAGCGGGSTEALPTDGDVGAAVDSATTDAAAAVSNAVANSDDSLGQVSDAVPDAVGGGWQDMQANWKDSIGSVKDRWAELTEEELLKVNGDRDQLVTLVQDVYGLDQAAAEAEVADWASSL